MESAGLILIKKNMKASQFISELKELKSDIEIKKYERAFPPEKRDGDKFIGVQMGKVFSLSKKYIEMSPVEIEKLLENPLHEVRAGAVSIIDFQARHKKTSPERKKELFDLYIKRHDRINNWDLVDRSAQFVVGAFLFENDKKAKILYKLAKSKNTWERRSAIVATSFFIKNGITNHTFKIAEMLLNDKEEFVNKAVGWMLRYAGDKEPKKLIEFLDKYVSKMPRVILRYSIEKLDKKKREHYLKS